MTEEIEFGLLEMQKFAEESDDPRVKLMWSKICDLRSKISHWLDSNINTNNTLYDINNKLQNAYRIINEIRDTFYGQNMEVLNWHKNGESEPIDNFFESNNWSINKENK